MFNRKIKSIISLPLVVFTILILTELSYAQCTGPSGEMLPASQCGGRGAGSVSGSGSGSGTIFNRQSGYWGNTGWGGGGGFGGGFGGGSGFFGGGTVTTGNRNFGGLSTPGGTVVVNRNFFGTGSGGGAGGFGTGGYNEQINAAACTLLGIPMGSFGALVMIVAGISAIVAGALGAYKMALSTIVIGAGSWVLFPIVQMFFPVQCGF
jgi:hypothetical protein